MIIIIIVFIKRSEDKIVAPVATRLIAPAVAVPLVKLIAAVAVDEVQKVLLWCRCMLNGVVSPSKADSGKYYRLFNVTDGICRRITSKLY